MSRGGGVVSSDTWTARVKTLKHGDCIKASHYAGETQWAGGEVWCVLDARVSGERDGFWYVDVYPVESPTNTRQLAIHPDDQVMIVTRPVSDEIIVSKKGKRPPKPKKGDQLKLF